MPPSLYHRLKAGFGTGQSSLVRNSASMMLTTAASQVIYLALTPIIARRYPPAAFGLLGFFNAITAVIQPLACLRFDYAIPVVEEENLGVATTVAALCCLCFGVVIAPLIFLAAHHTHWALAKDLMQLRWQISGAVFLLGLGQIAIFLATRQRRFVTVGLLKGSSNAVFALLAIIPLFGLIESQTAAMTFCLIIFVGNTVLLRSTRITAAKCLEHLRHYRSHILINFPTAIMDSLSLSAPVMVMNAYYSKAEVGNYAQIQRLGCGLLLLASAAIGQVFFQQASDSVRKRQDLSRLVWKTFGLLAGISLINALAIWLIGDRFFSHYIGRDWRTDTSFLVLATFPTLLRMMISPLSYIFFPTGRLKSHGLWQLLHFTMSFGLLPLIARQEPFAVFLKLFFLIELVSYSLYFLIILRASHFQHPIRTDEGGGLIG